MPRRDRIRRRRSPVARWAGRILGLIGTAAVLAVGVVAATMVISAGDEEAVSHAPTATPTPEAAGKRQGGAPRLTRSQREERRHAVDEVRRQGYTVASLDDYKVDHLLRVLIGKPVGTTPPGMRAFFFVDGDYIGQDATTASGKIRAGRQLEREITIVYRLYKPGDELCCPKGKETRVHYRWNGEALAPRETIPPAAERLPPA